MLPKPIRELKARKRVRRVKLTRPGKPSVKKLDDLFRAIVLARPGPCEAAGFKGQSCKGVFQTAHIISRQYKRNGLRWRIDNAFKLCAGHHFRWTRKNEAEWREFVAVKHGADYMAKLDREAIYGEKHDPVAVLGTLLALQLTGGTP